MPRPCSAEFKRLAQSSRTALSKIELLNNGRVLLSSDPLTSPTLIMVSGSVTMDITASVTGSCALTLVDQTGTLVPGNANDYLAPGINEIRLYAGYQLSSGLAEYVSMGVFSYDETDVVNTGDGLEISLTGYDRSGKVNLTRFAHPYVAGTSGSASFNSLNVMLDLITYGYPRVSFKPFGSIAVYQLPNPTVYDAQSNPWEAAQSLATSMGCYLFVDGDGDFVLLPVTNISPIPDWGIDEGANPIMLSSNSRMITANYNGAIVTGDGTGSTTVPAYGESWNTDPTDPMFYDPADPLTSNIGPRPEFYTSPLITTNAQAFTTAQTMVVKQRGNSQLYEGSILPNPAMEVLDTLSVTDTRLKLSGLITVLSRFSYTLGEFTGESVSTMRF